MHYGKKVSLGERVITFSQLLPESTPVKCIDLVRAEKGSSSCNSGYCIQDVIQGSLNDCYLMAGLASVAWAAPATMDLKYQAMASSLPDKKIPVDASDNPCYARIGPRNVIWPLIYERGYAKAKGCDPCGSLTKPTCIEGGTGLKGLQDITGWQKKEIPINDFDPNSADPNKKIPNNNGVATVPAVAWTSAGDPGNKIYANHTYSYLGHTDQYVVLRNPYGSMAAEPTVKTKGSGTWAPNCCVTINFYSRTDGIFAIELSYFKSKFAGIGYVTQR